MGNTLINSKINTFRYLNAYIIFTRIQNQKLENQNICRYFYATCLENTTFYRKGKLTHTNVARIVVPGYFYCKLKFFTAGANKVLTEPTTKNET
jgi:hypothetical protein